MCGPKFCAMKITQEVREYAKTDMIEMAATFREGGAYIYKSVDELEALKESNQMLGKNERRQPNDEQPMSLINVLWAPLQ